MRLQAGLFGLGGDGPSEASPTASLAKPSEDQSTEPPKPFQGKNQGENDTEQRNELTETGPSAATQVASPGHFARLYCMGTLAVQQAGFVTSQQTQH